MVPSVPSETPTPGSISRVQVFKIRVKPSTSHPGRLEFSSEKLSEFPDMPDQAESSLLLHLEIFADQFFGFFFNDL